VLAGLGIHELAAAAGVAPRTLHRLEMTGVIYVAEEKRHGHVQRAVWDGIVGAVQLVGVELLAEVGVPAATCAGHRRARGRRDRVLRSMALIDRQVVVGAGNQ
jgi:hypothetical protein